MIHTSKDGGFNRRSFLGLAGLSVTAVAMGGSLAGCSGTKSGGGASASADVKLPTYKEFTGVTTDLAGNANGLQRGFLKFPTPVQSVKSPPLNGTITALTETFEKMSPAMSDNPFWQRL